MQMSLLENSYEKFGFITDTHYDYKYESRKDDTLKTLLDKTAQCYDEFNRVGCSFVIHGGDVFNRHRIYNFDLIRGIRSIIREFNLKTYFILGQHDAMGYNKATLTNSNLGFVRDISDGDMIFIDDFIETHDYMIYASHVDMDVVQRINGIKTDTTKPVICVAHALLTDKREAFGTISIGHIKNPSVRLVLSGDLHDGIEFQKKNDIQFYNPGALARTERVLRIPKVGILTWNGKEFICKEFFPKCPKAEDIFFWDEPQPKIAITANTSDASFIESFKEFRSEVGNAFDLLLKVGETQKINPEVLEMIKAYKNKMDK